MKKPFETTVLEHGATVLRVCRAVVGPVDAEDAWSETFLAALQAYPDLPANANVQAWLVTIAHRKSIDIIRKSAKILPVAEMPDTAQEPLAQDMFDLDAATVWEAVKRLPPKQRQVVAYRYLGGISYTEIAAIVGGNAAAARRACSDGLINLRAIYAVHLDTPATLGGTQ